MSDLSIRELDVSSGMRAGLRRWIPRFLLTLSSVILTLLVIEGLLAFVLWYPSLLVARDGSGGRMLRVARAYHLNFDRRLVQLQPDCSRYDPGLTYTLIPSSSCTVTTREHRVEYKASRQGLRDDDASLIKPEIVVLGDSHAMGWGVAEPEGFPSILERDAGVSVLNAAISSYGTARELALLERLQLPQFPILIVQYCDNDFRENRSLVTDGSLKISSREEYLSQVAQHAAEKQYRLFRHLVYLFRLTRPTFRLEREPRADTNSEEARVFLEVLLRHKPLLEGNTVLVLETRPT